MPDLDLDLPESNPFFEGDPLAAAGTEPAAVVVTDPLVAADAVSDAAPTALDKPSAGIPRKVVEQLRKDRREAREVAAELQERLVVAETEARTARELAQGVQGLDPSRALWDQHYMNTLQAIAQRDPAFAKLAQQVIAAMEDSEMQQPDNTSHILPQQQYENQEPAAVDPRVEALYEREATNHVLASLDGLTPEFQAIFSKLVLGNSEDPLSMSRHQIRETVADYARENGFTSEQYLTPVKPLTAPSGQRAVPTPGPASSPMGTDGKPLPLAKNMQEWDENRKARLRQLIGS